MKNFIVQFDTKSGFKIRKSSLGGDILTNASIPAIGSAPILIPQDFKEFIHILMAINIPKQLKHKKRDRIITLRSHVGRRTFNAVTRSTQGSDKGKVNQGSDHLCETTLGITIGQYFYKPFLKRVI